MQSMVRVAGIVKILLAEWISLFILAGSYAHIRVHYGFAGCPKEPGALDLTFWLTLLVGTALFAWWIGRVCFPKYVKDVFISAHQAGPVIVYGLNSAQFTFCSTHPSYVFLDLITIGVGYFLYALGSDFAGCRYSFEAARGQAGLCIGLFFPVFRLGSWYLLQRRLPLVPEFEKVLKHAWKPVVIFYVIFSIPACAFGYFWGKQKWIEHKTPRMNAKTCVGGLFAHPEFIGKVIQVEGIQKWTQATLCDCQGPLHNDCSRAELLLDLEGTGEVVVQGSPNELVKEAKGNQGKVINFFGRLQSHPGKPLCGNYQNIPLEGRVFLQLELP